MEFHRLADDAQYFAANTDSIAERAPYYDPRRDFTNRGGRDGYRPAVGTTGSTIAFA